jgi:hypothetical protein
VDRRAPRRRGQPRGRRQWPGSNPPRPERPRAERLAGSA